MATITEDFWEQVGDRYYGPHDINETTDYPFDWATWLTKSGDDTIVNAQSVLDTGLVLDPVNGLTFTDTSVTIWVKGGTNGKALRLTCRITTAGGRIQDRSVFLRCRER